MKFFTPTSTDGQRTLKQHIFKSCKRLQPITGDSYVGNRALCTARMQLTGDGPKPLTIEEIEAEQINKDNLCKKCAKMAGYIR